MVTCYRWWNKPVSVLELSPPVTVQSDVSCSNTIKVLGTESFDQVPVVNKEGSVITHLALVSQIRFIRDVEGVVTLSNMTSKMLKGTVKGSDPVTKVLYKQFEMVSRTYKMCAITVPLSVGYIIHTRSIVTYP